MADARRAGVARPILRSVVSGRRSEIEPAAIFYPGCQRTSIRVRKNSTMASHAAPPRRLAMPYRPALARHWRTCSVATLTEVVAQFQGKSRQSLVVSRWAIDVG